MICSMVMTCNMDMQNWHGHAAWTCSMDIQHNIQQDMKHRHPAGHEAWTSCQDMQHGHRARTCSKDMQHRHSVWKNDEFILATEFLATRKHTVADNSSPDRCNRLAPCLALYICTLVVFPTSFLKFFWGACRLSRRRDVHLLYEHAMYSFFHVCAEQIQNLATPTKLLHP